MKRKLLSLALSFALCLTLLPGAALAADETTAATPDDASQSADTSAEAAVSAAPEYHANAKAALLIDLNTGRTIYEQDGIGEGTYNSIRDLVTVEDNP